MSTAMTALLIFVLSLTNIRFFLRDLSNYQINRAQTGLQRPYMQQGELDALYWVKEHSAPEDALQPLPWMVLTGDNKLATYDASLACFTPGWIHRKVYCGHWGETPDFQGKLGDLRKLMLPNSSADDRVAIIRKMKVRYLIFSQKAANDTSADKLCPMFRGLVSTPLWLSKVYSNTDADVYEIISQALTALPLDGNTLHFAQPPKSHPG